MFKTKETALVVRLLIVTFSAPSLSAVIRGVQVLDHGFFSQPERATTKLLYIQPNVE